MGRPHLLSWKALRVNWSFHQEDALSSRLRHQLLPLLETLKAVSLSFRLLFRFAHSHNCISKFCKINLFSSVHTSMHLDHLSMYLSVYMYNRDSMDLNVYTYLSIIYYLSLDSYWFFWFDFLWKSLLLLSSLISYSMPTFILHIWQSPPFIEYIYLFCIVVLIDWFLIILYFKPILKTLY